MQRMLVDDDHPLVRLRDQITVMHLNGRGRWQGRQAEKLSAPVLKFPMKSWPAAVPPQPVAVGE